MGVQAIGNPNIFQLSRIVSFRDSSSRVALPVDRSLVLYSRYKHVHGIPTAGDGKGMPLDRLRILDTLIDRLISLKSGGLLVKDVTGATSEEIDGLIKEYQAELHKSLVRQTELLGGSASSDLGLVVNMVA